MQKPSQVLVLKVVTFLLFSSAFLPWIIAQPSYPPTRKIAQEYPAPDPMIEVIGSPISITEISYGTYFHCVLLKWVSTQNVDYYLIYRIDANNNIELIKKCNTPEFNDTDAIAGEEYRYLVTAVRKGSKKPSRSVVNPGQHTRKGLRKKRIVALATPEILPPENIGPDAVKLRWTRIEEATEYQVLIVESSGKPDIDYNGDAGPDTRLSPVYAGITPLNELRWINPLLEDSSLYIAIRAENENAVSLFTPFMPLYPILKEAGRSFSLNRTDFGLPKDDEELIALFNSDNIKLQEFRDPKQQKEDFNNKLYQKGLQDLQINGSWVYFEFKEDMPAASKLEFSIRSFANSLKDMDFAIYRIDQPDQPVRASLAPSTGFSLNTTGLREFAKDEIESYTGDGFLAPLEVQPGEGYFLLFNPLETIVENQEISWSGSAAPYLQKIFIPIVGNLLTKVDQSHIISSEAGRFEIRNGSLELMGRALSRAARQDHYVLDLSKRETDRNAISIQIQANPIPMVTGGIDQLCPGETTILQVSEAYDNIKWSTGDTKSTIEVESGGGYTASTLTEEGTIILDARYIKKSPKIEFIDTLQVCLFNQPISLGEILIPDQVLPNSSGIWSGVGVEAHTGIFNPAEVGFGHYTYSYTFSPNGDCRQTDSVVIELVDPATKVYAGEDLEVCEDTPLFFLTGASPPGGIWSGPGVIDPQSGAIDLAQLQMDTAYTYTYLMESSEEFLCDVMDERTLTLRPLPDAYFAFDSDSICASTPVIFNNVSSDYASFNWIIDGESWKFNDPQEEIPLISFDTAGEYEITLSVSNACGFDTSTEIIKVLPLPEISFENMVVLSACESAPVNFENFTDSDYDLLWDFGDGETSTAKAPVHQYAQAGDYQLKLEAINNLGCRNTSSLPIQIFERPLAEFTVSEMEGCAPFEVSIKNSSQGNNLQFKWDFGDQERTDQKEPKIVFKDPGNYSVQLIAKNENACVDTLKLDKEIKVYETPIAYFKIELDPKENNLSNVQLFNTSSFADAFRWQLPDKTESTLRHLSFHAEALPEKASLTAYNFNEGKFTCSDQIRKTIEKPLLYAPSSFVPGSNNPKIRIFRPIGKDLKEYEISIYSRWGELIWQSTKLENGQPAEGWDGRDAIGGKVLSHGAYYWTAKVVSQKGETKNEQGMVTLIK